MAYFSPALVVLGIVVPLGISRFTNGPKPLSLFLLGVPMRLASGVAFAVALHITKWLYASLGDGEKPPQWFWGMFLGATAFNNVANNLMFVSQMSFFNKVSDPVIGGTYMTLLNTLANLGSKWPQSLSLALLDACTSRECIRKYLPAPSPLPPLSPLSSFEEAELVARLGADAASSSSRPYDMACGSQGERAACGAAGGECTIARDGYYVQLVLCSALGFCWFAILARKTWELQRLPKSAWALRSLQRD